MAQTVVAAKNIQDKLIDAKELKPKWVVLKYDERMEEYDEAKVADAIFLAAQDVGGTDYSLAQAIAADVTRYLLTQYGRLKTISTRDIGDAVERTLIHAQHVKTAKAYILNRDRKREEYEAKIRLGVRDDIGMELNALVVMRNKYLLKDEAGDAAETPAQAFDRVARALAAVEKGKRKQDKWFTEFQKVMHSRRMLPAGRTLANAGTINNQLANCFVMPFPDDIEEIFDAVKGSSVLKKNGGGVGFSFSKIRPKGDLVTKTSGTACGPVALMAILDHASDIFLQAGGRRSGNMVTLADNHPDIFDFITCKESGTTLPHINYSIEVSDALMKAAEADDDWDLINPRDGSVAQTVKARSVLDQAARLAWKNGDPGMIFIDEINRYNPTPHVARLETVNLCGEQPLLSCEACNLGSINLAAHVVPKKGKQSTIGQFEFDYDMLDESTRIGVRMLDNVISVCTYPLQEVDDVVKANRKIGLGVMGWADALIKLGIPYNSDKARKLATKVMKRIQTIGHETSEALGKEKGSFPNFKGSMWDKKRGHKHFRNATVTTIAPTGSLSMTAGCSGGIEPHFALAFFRKAMGSYELPEVNKDLVVALKRANGTYSSQLMNQIAKKGSIQRMSDIPDDIREVFVTSMDITPEDHILMQAAFQKYTDNAVSKTINMPHSATVEDVSEAFMLAWKTKCKGITVYRDGSRDVQVLNVGSASDSDGKKLPTSSTSSVASRSSRVATKSAPTKAPQVKHISKSECPECGATMMMQEGCKTCPACSYSACSI